MTQISQVHTPCKNCSFAIYKDNTQIDCALKYLDIYKSKNIEVLEVYDEEKEFYVVNDKKCIGYRNDSWLKDHDLINSSIEEKILQYNKSNHLSYTCVVNTKDAKFNDLIDIIHNIESSKILPKKLHIVRYNNNNEFDFNKLNAILSKLSYPWKIHTCVDDSAFEFFIHNVTINDQDARFILCINNLSELAAHKVIEKANEITHKNLDQFIAISLKDNHNIRIFNKNVYKFDKLNGFVLLSDEKNYILV